VLKVVRKNISGRLIVVLGMHRSGTSAITKSLELLGVGLGADLHPPGFDNPRGFWEDRECVDINDKLLNHFGSAYDRLGFAWDEIPTDSQISELKLRAIQLVSRKLKENNGIWGFKDPRTCRLLAFWNEVFLVLKCEVSFVIAVRNPASVVASLAARNNIPAEKSYFLWLQHVLPSLSFTEGARRIVVDYEELMANPYSQISRISDKLGLPLPDRQSSQVRYFEDNFLDIDLRHASFTEAELALDTRAPKMVATTYNLLHLLATDQKSLEKTSVQNQLVKLNALLSEATSTIVYINNLEDERMRLNQAVAERDGQITSLNQAVAERDGQITSLNQAVAERDGQITSLNQAVAERDGQIDGLNAERKHILDSTSWRFTRALRFFSRNFVKKPYLSLRCVVSDFIRQVWLNMPLSTQHKQLFKHKLFSDLPYLFRWSQAYRSWHAMSGSSNATYKMPANQVFQFAFKHTVNEYVPLLQALPPKDVPVRLIAFYLPQFHAIAENNEWWGEGFTEWTNVKPAQTQFEGHYQPHLPDELGYYDLLDSTTQRRQIELAKLHGVGGFCFYTYWFGGKLLLEKPIENYLKDQSLDLPFCLCWANENWSRRWDGLDSEILVDQKHSPEDDLAFIQHVSQYMRDERYIRIDGKPLLLIYRPSLFPSAKETAKRWRVWCVQNGIGEIYLAYTQSFETVDPSKYGFDAAIEFPPNNSVPPNITETIKPINESFGGIVYDWRIFVERSRNYKVPAYKLFRSVCPSWDNTARRKNKATIFLNSTPQGYQEWLTNAVTETCVRIENPNERFIFVNAWNEWAEGAHLEPDQRYGYAYLEATRNALVGPSLIGQQLHQIIVVSHDAHPHGAQYLALNMAREFSQGLGFSVDLICLGGGLLKEQYAQYTRLHDLDGFDHRGPEAHALVKNLVADGHRFAIVNTTVSGFFLETLKAHGIKCISLIHELRGVLDQHNLHEQAETIARLADRVVFAAQQVAEDFQYIAPVSDDRRILRPQGLYKKNARVCEPVAARQELRKALQLPLDAQIILGVGYADYRKGVDLFVEVGKMLVDRLPSAYLVWLGHWEGGMRTQVEKSLAKTPQMSTHFIFPGRSEDTDLFYAGADVYALTSREDPYPSVVLEAMDASLPVVGFVGVGGCAELLNAGCGKLVPAFDVYAFSSALEEILKSHDLANSMGQAGQALISERFSFRNYLFDLLKQIDYPLPRVSVVVPNYNYARFMVDRIRTVEKQKFPIYELIILDDFSTDNSVQVIKEIIQQSALDIKFVRNDTNSGSVFAQWQKGVELATGDLVWIAEADDLSEPNFLSEVLRGFDNPGVVLSYCESKQISIDGKVLCDNYLDYVADIDRKRWLKPYIRNGQDEISDALSVKNTIPNVSAVVFRRTVLSEVLNREQKQLYKFKVAGDWYTYIKLLEYGEISFTPNPVNIHRRHKSSVTNASLNFSQLAEVVRMQRLVASNHLVSDSVRGVARSYAQKLYEQFGLATRACPNFEQALELTE